MKLALLTSLLIASSATAVEPDFSWNADEGLFTEAQNGTPTCIPPAGPQTCLEEIVTHASGVDVMHVVEDSPVTIYSRVKTMGFAPHGNCPDPNHPAEDAVVEFTAQTLSGTWTAGMYDIKKAMTFTMEPGRVGIQHGIDDWLVFVNVDLSSDLHTFRIEKYARDHVRFLIDGQEFFDLDYCLLPAEPRAGALTTWAGAGTFARTTAEETAEFYVRDYQQHLGSVFMEAEVVTCLERGDLDLDGVVGINDYLILLANWGPCPQP